MKFVENLNEKELNELTKLFKESDLHRIRMRAHAIILSSRKFSIEDLSIIFDVHRDTISRWINYWNKYRFKGLEDAPKTGRPKKERKTLRTKFENEKYS